MEIKKDIKIDEYRLVRENIKELEEQLKDLNKKRSEFESDLFNGMDIGDELIIDEFEFTVSPGRRQLSPKPGFQKYWNAFISECPNEDDSKDMLSDLVKQQIIHKGPTLKQLETALTKSKYLQSHYENAKLIFNYSEGTRREAVKIVDIDRNGNSSIPGRYCFSKVVGMTYRERELGHPLPYNDFHNGDALILKREPENNYDRNAIRVYHKDTDIFIGYIKGDLAKTIAPIMDNGTAFSGRVTEITGGGDKEHGINIELVIE